MCAQNAEDDLMFTQYLNILATREATNEPHCGPEAQVKQLGPGAELRAEGDTGPVRFMSTETSV